MRLRSSEGWNEKSKPVSVLMVANRAIWRAALIRRPSLHGDLLGEQGVDRLDGAELAAVELLDDALERFQGARHAQADEVAPDPLDRVLRHG